MKTPCLKFLMLCVAVALFSCSKSETPIGPVQSDLSLVLKSDAGADDLNVLNINDEVNFTVIGNDGVDYTSSAKLYVNNNEITGSSYVFNESGNFLIKAVYNDVVSNTIEFQVLALTERALNLSTTRALRNQTITFKLFDANGDDTAADAIFFVNGSAITGTTYSSATEGEFEVYAEFEYDGETYTSDTKEFSVFIPKRKVVVEDYTGTWCGYCPSVALALENIQELSPYVSGVAIHETGRSLPDPMHFPQVLELKAAFDVGGLPQARINRDVKWHDPYPANEVLSMAGTETNSSIAIKSQITGSNLTVDIKLIYENGSEVGDKIVVYLLESGIVHPQVNYYNTVPGHPLEGKGDPIVDFVHNEALRNSLTNIFGDNVPEKAAYEVYPKSYSFSLPSEYVKENLSLVVMLVKADNSAKNSQYAKVGEDKRFE